MAHQCTFYCFGTRHATILLSYNPTDPFVSDRTLARYYGPGAHLLCIKPAPEYSPKPEHAGLTPFLLIIDAPAYDPEKAQWP